jgi:hypothetical protein
LRRQLTTSQRAAVALQIKPMFEAKAQENLVESGKGKGLANLPNPPMDSRKQASKAVNVGERIVQDAQFVRDNDPEAYL